MATCSTCGTDVGDLPCPTCAPAPSQAASGVETVRCLLCRADREVPADAGYTCPGCSQQLIRFQCPHCDGPGKAWLAPGAPFTSCLGCGRKVELGMISAPPTAATEPVCPYCQTRGSVRTREEMAKQGVSGTKATAAVVTGGLSVLATGLSRKGLVTRATCDACGASWTR